MMQVLHYPMRRRDIDPNSHKNLGVLKVMLRVSIINSGTLNPKPQSP